MNRVGLLYDPVVLDHQPPPGHPERPARVAETFGLLEANGLLSQLVRLPVIPATREQIARIHDPRYIDAVEWIAAQGGGRLDVRDTVASPGSWRAVTAAAGGAIVAVDAVMRGTVEAAFALGRPPGHHARPGGAMGFCIFNHAAIAAAHAVAAHGLSRVLIVDFDVHHGNGTQEAFYDDPHVLYFSAHQSPAYPFTGTADEIGTGNGSGYTVNVPLPPNVDDVGFQQAFSEILRPVADRFRPELVILSAGYDAHWRNSAYVEGIRERMTVEGLAALSADVRGIADAHCPGRLVGILEGGYDLEALAYGVCATLHIWLGDDSWDDTIGPPPDSAAPPDIAPLLASIRRIHGL